MLKNIPGRQVVVVSLFVTALGLFALSLFVPFAYASTVAIQSLSPSNTVSVGTTVQFDAIASGFNSPTYTVSDSLGGSSITNSNINSAGHFSWAPISNDVGTHNITINISDSSGDNESLQEQIIVNSTNSSSVSIQAIYPGSTVTSGQNVTLVVASSGFVNPTYSLSDSYSGNYSSTLSNSNINSSGYLVWATTQSDIGTHNITVTVTDSTGQQGSASQTITVQGPSVVISGLTQSIIPGTSVSFTSTAQGFTNPTFTISDLFSGSTISNADIDSNGNFHWTPTTSDVGTHSLTVYANDPIGHSGNEQFPIVVTASGQTVSTVTATSITSETPNSVISEALCPNGNTSASNCATAPNVAPVASTATFTSYLTLGTTNNEVALLQKFLAQQGFFSGTATGYYGSLTEAAVKKFQTAHNIQALGVVGPATRVILNQLYNTPSTIGDGYKFSSPITIGSTGAEVTELQKRLTAEGVYSGPITGSYGSQTETAVKTYQGKHNLAQLGNLGPGTRMALNQ